MRLLMFILKRFIIGAFLLYLFNYFVVSFNLIIPINFYSLSIVSFLGIFGLIGLVLFRLMFL